MNIVLVALVFAIAAVVPMNAAAGDLFPEHGAWDVTCRLDVPGVEHLQLTSESVFARQVRNHGSQVRRRY